jgi:hypothetical protein
VRGVTTLPPMQTEIAADQPRESVSTRDVVALVVMMIGVGLTISAAYLTDVRLGLAVTGLVVFAVGATVGLDRATDAPADRYPPR